ncbi:hypothetical protein Pfo_003772 [Paulownia fortunei]|nr:hypothetical protein Pfo_003772 [Paulownia fortunei]
MECAQVVRIAFSCSNTHGQSSILTYKRALKVTVESRSPAATATSIATIGRLKREDFSHLHRHHRKAFTAWKILIGASDWKDYSMGKEGAEKYRTQNLPNSTSCPGVYELGIATLVLPRPGRESRKLGSSSVVPVYVGQADNVRTRLQQYGRHGAHLENGSPNEEFTHCPSVSSLQGPGLFSGIFSKGSSIVYRLAPMKSKKDAEKFEDQLLGIYDYAWNKRSNGYRRPVDIHKKLDCCAKKSQFSLLHIMLQYFHQKILGGKTKTCDPFLLENRYNSATGMDSKGILSRIFRIKRLQPRRVQSGSSDDSTGICGVAIGHKSICTKPPVEGRKRCAEHKGMKVNGFISKLKRWGRVPYIAESTGSI